MAMTTAKAVFIALAAASSVAVIPPPPTNNCDASNNNDSSIAAVLSLLCLGRGALNLLLMSNSHWCATKLLFE